MALVDQKEIIENEPIYDSAFKVRLTRNLEILSNVLANPTTVIGLIIVILMISMALFAPIITEPNTPDPYQMPRDWKAARSAPFTLQDIFWERLIGAAMFFMVLYGELELH